MGGRGAGSSLLKGYNARRNKLDEGEKRMFDAMSLGVWRDRVYINGLTTYDKIWLEGKKDVTPTDLKLGIGTQFKKTRKGYGFNEADMYLEGQNANHFFKAFEARFPNALHIPFDELQKKVQRGDYKKGK